MSPHRRSEKSARLSDYQIGPDNIPAEALKLDRMNCRRAPDPIQEDLGERTSATDRLKRSTPYHNTKERRSEQVCKLQCHQTTVNTRKTFQ
ncbi:unnamed protein product [Schistosoma mattheei]|uniref:Uncharacterized protein n=1 Tax=Schistosoma mattheei TaxID=31246 RepID=A0A183NGY9_9TREM|nr:unnamed protein product [Schistosoma mattheei]